MKFLSQKVKDKIWVQYKGKIFAMPATLQKFSSSSSAEEEELTAPFSCKILKIHAKAGMQIKKGDPVLVVEAMKMEYSYTSPKDGTIELIKVCEGTVVQQGTHFVKWKK